MLTLHCTPDKDHLHYPPGARLVPSQVAAATQLPQDCGEHSPYQKYHATFCACLIRPLVHLLNPPSTRNLRNISSLASPKKQPRTQKKNTEPNSGHAALFHDKCGFLLTSCASLSRRIFNILRTKKPITTQPPRYIIRQLRGCSF